MPPRGRGVHTAAALLAVFLTIAIALSSKDRKTDPQSGGDPTATSTSNASRGLDGLEMASHPEHPPKMERRVPALRTLEQVPVRAMPPIDLEQVTKEALALEQERHCGAYRFAKAIDVALTPDNSGLWETLPDGRSVWRLRLRSEGARSLNLGFHEYRMPAGGSLSVFPSDRADDRPIRQFTELDNEEHGQLWTPILSSDELTLEVTLPPGSRDELVLKLAKVNHGFRSLRRTNKIGGDTSGACNIDVACTEDPVVGVLIEAYADQIRSVGAYTIAGIDTCSGALVNNTSNDRTPYFLTAEHCGLSPGNVPSVVAYFNFENSSCRTPGSSASGNVGDGDLSQFMSGALYRAEFGASDFCLIELDDPIPQSYDVFFAGWDRTGGNDIAVGIHHPAVAEKRISFELDSTVNDGSTHVRVTDWDHGTTEGGSSGSPLFDSNGRIIGDLTGGFAACGNDDYDTYGRFSVSWTGGGSTATRLSDWLDPAGTGATTLNGINQALTPPVIDSPLTANGFVGSPFNYRITAGSAVTSYSIASAPQGMTVNGDTGEISWTPSSTGPASVTITATNPAGSDSKVLMIDVAPAVLPVVLDTHLALTPGPLAWLAETIVTHDGVDAARSPDISDNQTAYFETQVTAPPGGEVVSFWWKVSSEPGYDFLRFFVDGVQVASISGEEDWTRVSHLVPGGSTATLRWEYAKDGSVSEGLDAGFIDELALATADPLPSFHGPGETFGYVGESFSFQVEAFGATAFNATNLPPGLGIDPANGLITGTPTSQASTTSTITASNASGSRQQQLEIHVSQPLDFALNLDLPQVVWGTYGPAFWFPQAGTTHDGVLAVESAQIGNSQSSTLSANVHFDGTQELTFWWKVSSEEGYDGLVFRLQDVPQNSISGEIDWVQQSAIIPAGPQSLTWTFVKDGSVSEGSDAGWVDEVSFSYLLDAPASVAASDGTLTQAVNLTWSAVTGAESYRIFRHTSDDLTAATLIASVPDGTLAYDDSTAVEGVSHHYWVRAFNAANALGAPDGTDTGFRTSPYLDWASINGLSGTHADRFATPFGDGVENLLKFAFNMNGSGPDRHLMTRDTGTSGLPLIEPSGEGVSRVFRFEFVRRIGGGLSYAPQISQTLDESSWTGTTATPAVTPIDSTWERVVIEEPVGAANHPKLFARVKVTSSP